MGKSNPTASKKTTPHSDLDSLRREVEIIILAIDKMFVACLDALNSPRLIDPHIATLASEALLMIRGVQHRLGIRKDRSTPDTPTGSGQA